MVKYLDFRSTDTLQKFLDENFLSYRDLNDLLKLDEIPTESLDKLIFNNYPFLTASRKKLLEDISLKRELHKENCIFYLSEETAEGVKSFLPQKSEHKPVPFISYDFEVFEQLVQSYAHEEQLEIVVVKIIKNTPLNNHKLNFIITEIFEAHPNTEELISEIFFHDLEKEEEKKKLKKQVQEELVSILQPILSNKPTSFEQFINQLNANGVIVAAHDEILLFSYNQQITSFETFVFDEGIGEEKFDYQKLQSLFVKNAEESNQSFFALLKSGQYKQTLLLQGANTAETVEQSLENTDTFEGIQEPEPNIDSNIEAIIEEATKNHTSNLEPIHEARNNFNEEEEPDIDEDALATQQMLKATEGKEISKDDDEEPVIKEDFVIEDNFEYA